MEFLMCSFGHHRLYTLVSCLEVWSSRCLTMAHRGNCKSSETDVRDPGFSHSIFPLSHARSSCPTATGLRRSVCFCIRFGMLHVLVILPHRHLQSSWAAWGIVTCLRNRAGNGQWQPGCCGTWGDDRPTKGQCMSHALFATVSSWWWWWFIISSILILILILILIILIIIIILILIHDFWSHLNSESETFKIKSVAWFICEHPGQLISQTQGLKIQTIEKKFLCRYYTPSNTKYIPNIYQILGWKSTLREELSISRVSSFGGGKLFYVVWCHYPKGTGLPTARFMALESSQRWTMQPARSSSSACDCGQYISLSAWKTCLNGEKSE